MINLLTTVILPSIKWVKGNDNPDQEAPVSLSQEMDTSIEGYNNGEENSDPSPIYLPPVRQVEVPKSRLGKTAPITKRTTHLHQNMDNPQFGPLIHA